MTRYLFTLFLLCFCLAADAQQQPEYFEQPGLRISPQWLAAVENGSYDGWAGDACVAPDGRSYSTGTYSGGLYVRDTLKLIPASNNAFYLIGREPGGRLSWVATSGGRSRGKALTLAPNGDIIVAGIMTEQKCTFYGASRGDSLTLTAPSADMAAFFIRYSPAGKILKGVAYASGSGVEINDLRAWKDKGFIASGFDHFRLPGKPSEVKYRMLIVRLDNDLKVTLEKTSTAKDHDVCFSAAADGPGNIYFATYFSTGFLMDGIALKGGYYHSSVIGKLNKKGRLQWMLKSTGSIISQVHVAEGGQVTIAGEYGGALNLCPAADSACTPLLTTRMPDRNEGIFVLRLDGDGRVQWVSHGESYFEFKLKGAYGDAAGNLYLTAGANGCRFYSTGHTDSLDMNDGASLCLKYSNAGKLEWLKSFNKNLASDYMQPGADAAGNVYVAGQYSEDKIIVGDTVRKRKQGRNQLYTFCYSRQRLEDGAAQGKVILPPSITPKEVPWTVACQCTTTPDPEKILKPGGGLYWPSLDGLYDATEWTERTGTRLRSQAPPNRLFYYGFQSETGFATGYSHYLNIASRQPISLDEASGNFVLGLTPCVTEGFYTVPALIYVTNPASQRQSRIDAASFKGTNREAYELIVAGIRAEDHELLRSALYQDKTPAERAAFQQQIGTRYKVAISTDPARLKSEAYWETLSAALKQRGIIAGTVLYDLLLAKEIKAGAPADDRSLYRMSRVLFPNDDSRVNAHSLYNYIYPQATTRFDAEKVRFSFPSGLLYGWDEDRGRVLTDSSGKVPFSFLIAPTDKRITYTSDEGWDIRPADECRPAFTIAGTGIVFLPAAVQYGLHSFEQHNTRYTVRYAFSGLNARLRGRQYLSPAAGRNAPAFLGFHVADGAMVLPAAAGGLRLPVRYSFSDRVLVAELDYRFHKDARGTVVLEGKDGEQPLPLGTLLAALAKAGIRQVATAPLKGTMYIGFVWDARQGNIVTGKEIEEGVRKPYIPQ